MTMAHSIDGELLAAEIPRLRRYARALTRNGQAADDLVQDCLERAWSKGHQWEAGTDLCAWLFTVMHNLYVNGLRRRQPQTDPIGHAEFADPRTQSQEASMQVRDLEQALGRLPPEQREVLLLVCLEEMSYEQVASVTGVPIGTVMSRLHRARERMRRFMSGEQSPTGGPVIRRVK